MEIKKIDITGNQKVKMLKVDGLTAAQSYKVIFLLEEIKQENPELIIEIGTCRGGFSLLLRHYFPHAQIYTIDNTEWEPKELKKSMFEKYNINYILDDCFVSQHIKSLLADKRKKIVFCDGGNKSNEFNFFKEYINNGDVIGVHDYFERITDRINNIWTTCETTKSMLNLTSMKECNYKHSKLAVWGLFKKILKLPI